MIRTQKIFPKLGRLLKNDNLGELGRVILGETPIGSGWRIAKGVIDIFDTDDDEKLVEAYANMTPEQKSQIMALQAEAAIQESKERQHLEDQITARHAADMLSGERITKLIRPVGLAVTVGAAITYYIALHLILALGVDLTPDELDAIDKGGEAIVGLATAFVGFYVSGRTLEKGTGLIAAKLLR